MAKQLVLGAVGALAVLMLSSCGSCPKKVATSTDPSAVAPDPGATAPATPSAYDAAKAEVARLTTLADQNVLLAAWTGPYGGVPPWDKVQVSGFGPAFEIGLALQLAEIDVIAENPEAPSFANTLVPLEDNGRHQNRAETLFAVHSSNLSTPEVQAVEREWAPKLAELNDKIIFNPKLFARVSAVHQGREAAGLSAEQRRLVERTYEQFQRAGAKLDDAQKKRLGEINQELAVSFTEFGKKLLADEQTWIALDKPADLDGLSDSLRAAYKNAATERKLEGKWVGHQHPLQRGSVPRLVEAPRSAREGVEGVQEARRQRRRQRHRRDDHQDRQAARRARHAAGLRLPRALAHVGHHGRGAAEGTGPDEPRLAGGSGARQRRGRRHAGDRQERARQYHHRAVGLPLLFGESAQGQVRARSERDQAVLRAQQHGQRRLPHGGAALRADVQGDSPVRCRCSIPTSASGR